MSQEKGLDQWRYNWKQWRSEAFQQKTWSFQRKTWKQWRSEAKFRPGTTTKVPPFSPLKFAYKNLKWKKIMFRTYLKR